MIGALARMPATLRTFGSSQVSNVVGLLIVAAALALTLQHVLQHDASFFFQILTSGSPMAPSTP